MLVGGGQNRLVLGSSVSSALANSAAAEAVLGLASARRVILSTRSIAVDDMTTDPDPVPLRSTRRVTIEELAATQGVKPMESTEEWAADIFESDEELEAFLAHLRVSRVGGR